jgi:hypothetical protein
MPIKSIVIHLKSHLFNDSDRDGVKPLPNITLTPRKNSTGDVIHNKRRYLQGGLMRLLKAPVNGVRSLVRRTYASVTGVYRNIRHKAQRNRNIATDRIHSVTDAMFNRTLVSSCSNSIEEDDSNITPYGDLNEDVAFALTYLSKDEAFWKFMNEEQGIKVWKTNNPLCDDSKDKKWVCIMAKTVINAPMSKIVKLLLESDKVTLLNRFVSFTHYNSLV